jgi:acyl dehydratase
MPKISDIKVGQVLRSEFDQITRELLQKYAKSSGDTNPIHTNDVIAERAGLKGVIAHGLFSSGFIIKMLDDFVGESGKLIELDIEMRGMVRVGDTLITEGKITKIEGKKVFLDIKQTTITPVDIKKDGNVVKLFEAGERGYISDKDIARGLVKNREVKEGTLTYRERVAAPGHAIIKLNE